MVSLEQVEFYVCLKITDAGIPSPARLPKLHEADFSGLPGVTLPGTKVFQPEVHVFCLT